MHRWTWAIAFLTACVYTPSSPGDVDPDDPDDPDPTQTIDASCFAPGSLLCLEFEGDVGMSDTRATDGSGNGFDATVIDVAEVPRLMSPAVTDDDAAGFGVTSRMTIAEELGLTGSVTVEMWAQTTFSNSKLFDSSGRIYLMRNDDDQFECGINGGSGDQRVDGGTNLGGGAWHHVACVFDASSREIKVFVDGNVDDCKTLSQGIDVSRTGSTTLGAGNLGAIDSVHVYTRALAASEICTSAGRGTSCSTTCPINPIEEGGPGGPGGPGGFD